MQNIDPLYFLTPVVTLGSSFGLVAYLALKRRFSLWTLLASLVSYAGAIALKEAVQAASYQAFDAAVGGNLLWLGLYFGSQTVVFEVGGAFLVAAFAVSRHRIGRKDAAGFGAGLAMWENGVLVGGTLLLDYLVYYLVLGSGGSSAALLSGELSKDAPALFYQASAALPLIGYATLERVSSLLAHFAWGYLAVLAAVTGRRAYLGIALPMGLVDAVVPLSSSIGLGRSEALIFAFSAASFAVALAATRKERAGALSEEAARAKN